MLTCGSPHGRKELLVPKISQSPQIHRVKFVALRPFGDERGRFLETFRKEWFPERSWERLQSNVSYSKAGVLRGLHFHFHQVDYWFCVQGRIQVVLADLRPDSPTFRQAESVEIGERYPLGVFIPVGVAHGFLALTDAALAYNVDNYYDSTDEHGVAWDDPELAVDWLTTDPLLSERDRSNPRLAELPKDSLPHLA